MSLDWNSTKCRPALPENDAERGWRHGLIWATLAVGLGRITKDNVDEWMFRIRWLERARMSVFGDKVPESAVRRWIGLGTNVPDVKRPAWLKQKAEMMEREVENNLACERSEAAKPKKRRAKK